MQSSGQPPREELEIKACMLLLAVHQAPDSVERRAALVGWVQEHPAHRQVFDALDQSLETVAHLLEQIEPLQEMRHR